MQRSRVEIERHIGRPVRHLAYPYGKKGAASDREAELARELGFSSAVTTRIGNLCGEHREHLLMLPRIPLYEGGKNGRLSDLFLSGMYTACTNGFKRVVTN
jgi:peptidoglycan/xylan/chitin deacetylase (PgdA/CDA1 family)